MAFITRLISLSFVCLMAASCSPRKIVFINPGKYILEGEAEENAYNVSDETYFVASLTEYSHYRGEAESFMDNQMNSGETGHWYVSGYEYLLDLSWKNCAFETMPSLFQGGCYEDVMILWSPDDLDISVDFVGMKKSDSITSVKIDCHGGKGRATFMFTQSIEE